MTIMNMALVETLSCSLQTRNTKFLIAPSLNQVSMSMCLNQLKLVTINLSKTNSSLFVGSIS